MLGVSMAYETPQQVRTSKLFRYFLHHFSTITGFINIYICFHVREYALVLIMSIHVDAKTQSQKFCCAVVRLWKFKSAKFGLVLMYSNYGNFQML